MMAKTFLTFLYVYVLELLFYIIFFASYRITDQDLGLMQTHICMYTHRPP